jgi:hypothetical protein
MKIWNRKEKMKEKILFFFSEQLQKYGTEKFLSFPASFLIYYPKSLQQK